MRGSGRQAARPGGCISRRPACGRRWGRHEMSASTSAAATRTLAQFSVLVSIANVLATVWALVLLPNAATTGQWLVLAAGAAVSASAFAFGVMTSLRSRLAR